MVKEFDLKDVIRSSLDSMEFIDLESEPRMPAERFNPNALDYWFPKIEAAEIPVPKTIILKMSAAAWNAAWKEFEPDEEIKADSAALDAFVDQVKAACEQVGYPAFLRTAFTSAKHEWDRTCFIPDADAVRSHLLQIAYFTECVDMVGEMPWTTWVVREYLPVKPLGVCPGYDNMPICREFRFFVDDGKVVCFHPYWPAYALEQGGAIGFDVTKLNHLEPGDEAALHQLAERAGAAVGGAWSVDILETSRGWYVTDMAVAAQSFHWDGCPNAGEP